MSLGHSKAVRDISFNNTGAQFLSAAYDRYVKLWDTETGRWSRGTESVKLIIELSLPLFLWKSSRLILWLKSCRRVHWSFYKPEDSLLCQVQSRWGKFWDRFQEIFLVAWKIVTCSKREQTCNLRQVRGNLKRKKNRRKLVPSVEYWSQLRENSWKPNHFWLWS